MSRCSKPAWYNTMTAVVVAVTLVRLAMSYIVSRSVARLSLP
jgi:hypothetical protein